MWVRRTKEQIHRAAVRHVKIVIQWTAGIFVFFTCYYFYRMSHHNPNHHPYFRMLFVSAAIAAIVVLFLTFGTVLDEWLHLKVVPALPGTASTRDMLCMKCWYVQDYSENLVCTKCGGACEDAKWWTWIDDDESAERASTPPDIGDAKYDA